jgi:hypothetical protein
MSADSVDTTFTVRVGEFFPESITFRRPTPEQIDDLINKQARNAAADPEFPETFWIADEYFMLSFSGEENDFAWSFSIKNGYAKGDPDEGSGHFHSIAGDHWCESAAQAKERARYFLMHGGYPPEGGGLRVYHMGSVQ